MLEAGYPGGYVADGGFEAELPPGAVQLVVERGTEFLRVERWVQLRAGEVSTLSISLNRWEHLAEQGWWSADLHVHRNPKEIPTLMRAEDLNLAPVISVWNTNSLPDAYTFPGEPQALEAHQFFSLRNYEDERQAGAVLLFNLPQLPKGQRLTRWYPSLAGAVREGRALGVHVDLEKPIWWGSPIVVALERLDSMGLANNHFCRYEVLDNEAWGRRRDRRHYPGIAGFTRYVLELYYCYLNLGFQIAASAGSASGVLPNPVGFNRSYVHLGTNFSYAEWFRGQREGRNFVTNGPILFLKVDGQEPGARLERAPGSKMSIHVEARSRNPLELVEVVANGRVVKRVNARGKSSMKFSTSLQVEQDTWVAARCFEADPTASIFAHTSPVYVSLGREFRDAEAARFFVQWIRQWKRLIENEGAERVSGLSPGFRGVAETPLSSSEKAGLLDEVEKALGFYQQYLQEDR